MKLKTRRAALALASLGLASLWPLSNAAEANMPGKLDVMAAIKAPTLEPYCYGLVRSGHKHEEQGGGWSVPGDMDDWYFKASIYYQNCWVSATGEVYVVLEQALYGYNREGKKQSCHWYDGGQIMKNVKVNSYFWQPMNGVNINPGVWKLPCRRDTTEQGSYIFPPESKIPVVDDTRPKARFHFHGNVWIGLFEPTVNITMTLRPCSGVGNEPCKD